MSKDRDPPLEPFLSRMGKRMPRCQAVRGGKQCSQPARKGFDKCWKHGPGSAKRVKEGSRADPTTARLTHGLYSRSGKSKIQELRELVHASGRALDDSDEELATLKAVVWALLEKEEQFQGALESLEAAHKRVQEYAEMLKDAPDPYLLEKIGRTLGELNRSHAFVSGYTREVSDHAYRVVAAIKTRAETRAKNAEAKALEAFLALTETLKEVMLEVLSLEQYERVHAALEARVLPKVSPSRVG
ncbi:hypothetical protein [Calidithermus chliarophilus]|uniref:hypothetical protein n=1 Tax=Calidithermus chliarophilus TaxID=52023 RepID=UPI0003FB880F|nr:hypothetical protein [Calidithermus chliarophilus]